MVIGLKEVIDKKQVGGLQIAIVAVISLVSILDGLDLQVVSFAAPLITTDLGLSSAQFAPIVAAALIGMACGALVGGWLGDRIGRRLSLLASVMLFGLATVGCGFTNSVIQLVLLRFIGGLGFGAAFPTGTAMVTEWMPRRWAGPATVSVMIGVPLGGLIGAAITAQLLPIVGWRICFVIFGAAPIVLGVALFFVLPESPAYLVLKGRQEALRKLLVRAFGPDSASIDARYTLEGSNAITSGVFAILVGRDRRMSAGLWLSFFFQNIATYAFIGWTPVVLVGLGMPLPVSIRGLLIWNATALVGVILGGFAVKARGTRFVMIVASIFGSIGAIALAVLVQSSAPYADVFTFLVLAGLAFEGFCVGNIQTCLFVVAANAYETRMKARGIGFATAFGRLGGISSAFASGILLGIGHNHFFFMVAAVFVIVFAGQFLIVRHFLPTDGNAVVSADLSTADAGPSVPA